MKKKIIIFSIIIVSAIIASVICFTNKSIIPDITKMSRIIADIYTIDAVGQARGNLHDSKSTDKYMLNGYHTILEKYGINRELYDSALVWYSENPDKYAEVYEKVVNILTQREAVFKQLINKRDSIQRIIDNKQDAITKNYWKSLITSIKLPRSEKDTFPKDLKYQFNLGSVKGGKLKLKMEYFFSYTNRDEDQPYTQLLVYYNNSLVDTVLIDINKKSVQQVMNYQYNVSDTICATRAEITLLKIKNLEHATATFTNINFSYVPYEVTDSIKIDEILFPPLFTY